ncbi:MAG: hypothetical protein JRJ87_07050 [Deltaproteobacteria bacterium]|nr:hypothetical protein [Deltaproteobacteria bacterium]
MRTIVTKKMLFSLVAGLCLLSSPALAESDILGLPAYPTVKSLPFRGKLQANSVPMETSLIETDDKIDTVIAFYKKALTARGKKIVEHMFNPNHGYVGFFDMNTRTMRMATVFTTPQGGSMIILSSMDPRPLARPAQIPENVPSLAGASGTTTTEVNEGNTQQRTIRYDLKGVAPEQAQKQLIAKAEEEGWHVDQEEMTFGKKSVVLKRENETCILRIDPVTDKQNKKVYSSVTMIIINNNIR